MLAHTGNAAKLDQEAAAPNPPEPILATEPDPVAQYWERRKDSIYIFTAQRICRMFCPEPRSVLDVGSNGTPTLEWHRPSATRLVSLDLRRPYLAPGVEAVRSDFLEFSPESKFDLVTCFQVLEHLRKPTLFAQKLLELSSVCVVSVPYKWPKGKCKGHVQDPVDVEKMLAWFGREPDYQYVANELHGINDRPGVGRRLIHVYANEPTAPESS